MLVAIDDLRSALAGRAEGLGFGPDAAALLADHLLDAELRGAATHGAGRMRWIAAFADLRPDAAAVLVERGEGIARYDAAGTLGYLALARAIDRELADPPEGARIVSVGACFPTGRLGYFAERVATAGLVGLVCASSTPRLGHPDGGGPAVGTNPFCLALPGDPPTVIDVSMGRITYGEVLRAAAAGDPLEPRVAARPDGADEPDPAEVIAGRAAIVPFGGEQAHKGFALALLVELLARSIAPVEGDAALVLMARPPRRPPRRSEALQGLGPPATRAPGAGLRRSASAPSSSTPTCGAGSRRPDRCQTPVTWSRRLGTDMKVLE